MGQPVLLCPGPVNVTSAVRRAVAGPDLCHREPEFSRLLTGVRRKLLTILGVSATHTAAIVSGSGTAALEAAVLSSTRPGHKLLVIENGVYGERIVRIAALHGIGTVHLRFPILQWPSLARIAGALRREPLVDTVAMVHHETSTGLLNPAREVATLVRQHRKRFLLDAISSLGAEVVPLDAVDLCVGSAGKCLHGYPGLSFVLVARRALPGLAAVPPRSLYLDLRTLLVAQEDGEPPFTPAVPLVRAFDAALSELMREGLAARIRRYRGRAAFLRRGFTRLGFSGLVPAELQGRTLTALRLPRGVRYERLHDALKADGFVIYAGQSRLRRSIFRIAHMGALTQAQMSGLLRSLARFLRGRRPADAGLPGRHRGCLPDDPPPRMARGGPPRAPLGAREARAGRPAASRLSVRETCG